MVTSLWINRLRELCYPDSSASLLCKSVDPPREVSLRAPPKDLFFFSEMSFSDGLRIIFLKKSESRIRWLLLWKVADYILKKELDLCWGVRGKKGSLCVRRYITNTRSLKVKKANVAPGDFLPVNKETLSLGSDLHHPHKVWVKFLFMNISAGSLNGTPHDRPRPSQPLQSDFFLF